MDSKTKQMVRDWLALHQGNAEALARWMRDALRIGSITKCRGLIAEAVAS